MSFSLKSGVLSRTKSPHLLVRLLARLRAQHCYILDLSPLAADFMQPRRMPDQRGQNLDVFVVLLVLMTVSVRTFPVLSNHSFPIDTPEHRASCIAETVLVALLCRSDARTLVHC